MPEPFTSSGPGAQGRALVSEGVERADWDVDFRIDLIAAQAELARSYRQTGNRRAKAAAGMCIVALAAELDADLANLRCELGAAAVAP